MQRRFFLVLTTLLAGAFIASAADVNGKWVAQVPGRDGQTREQTFKFTASGDKLTGTVSGFQGQEMQITDGKVSGDSVSFKVTAEFNGNQMNWTYSGTVSGDELKLSREGGRGGAREFTAKRAK